MLRIVTSKRLKELEDIEEKFLIHCSGMHELSRWLCPVIKEIPVIMQYLLSGFGGGSASYLRDHIRYIREVQDPALRQKYLDQLEDMLKEGRLTAPNVYPQKEIIHDNTTELCSTTSKQNV